MKARIDCFSGTGNADRAAGILERELSAALWKVDRRAIGYPSSAAAAPPRAAPPPTAEAEIPDGLYVLVCPVYAFMPPVLVKRWIRRLPRGDRGGERVPAIVLCVDGGGGGQAPDMACRMLARRGYRPFASANVSYAANWTVITPPPPPEAQRKATAAGDAAAKAFAQRALSALAAGRTELRRGSPGSAALEATVGALFSLVGRRGLGKLFFADSDCTRCGLCSRICPAGTIGMKDGTGPDPRTYPFWKANCENCCRCINLCPARAINSSWGRMIVIGAVSVAATWTALGPFMGWLRPILAAPGPLGFAASTAAFILSQALVLGPFDRYVLRPAMRLPALRRFFSWSFTKEYGRYAQEGFKPSSREAAP